MAARLGLAAAKRFVGPEMAQGSTGGALKNETETTMAEKQTTAINRAIREAVTYPLRVRTVAFQRRQAQVGIRPKPPNAVAGASRRNNRTNSEK